MSHKLLQTNGYYGPKIAVCCTKRDNKYANNACKRCAQHLLHHNYNSLVNVPIKKSPIVPLIMILRYSPLVSFVLHSHSTSAAAYLDTHTNVCNHRRPSPPLTPTPLLRRSRMQNSFLPSLHLKPAAHSGA